MSPSPIGKCVSVGLSYSKPYIFCLEYSYLKKNELNTSADHTKVAAIYEKQPFSESVTQDCFSHVKSTLVTKFDDFTQIWANLTCPQNVTRK